MKIIVLAGGISSERDVSISTGKLVCKALRENGHQAAILDVFFGYQGEDLENFFDKTDVFQDREEGIQAVNPDLDEIKALRGGDPSLFFGPNVIELCRMADIVYMALHGAEGENGKVQAAFDLMGIRYTGSGYLGSALAMDKGIAKKIFLQGNIPTPKGCTVTADSIRPLPEEIGFPCVVKPCSGGSSVGVSIAANEEEYRQALKEAFHYETEVVVEEYIKGREFSVGVIDGEVYPVIEIIPREGYYDYKTKYQPGMAQEVCPADLDEAKTREMQQYAADVYRELKMEIYGRVDFLMDQEGKLYCLEANTLPGMTPTSLLPQEAAEAGVTYAQLCEKIITLAMKRYSD